MIEGGGLGVYPSRRSGTRLRAGAERRDRCRRERRSGRRAVAKKYLSYFQGALKDWDCADQRLLRRAIPENRLRVYDVRQ